MASVSAGAASGANEGTAFVEPPTANAAVGRAGGAAVVVASDGGGHGKAAPGAAAWLADFTHDSVWRNAMVLEMQQGGQVYSEEETAMIAKGMDLFDSVAAGTSKARPLRLSKTVTAWTKHDKNSGLLLGHAEATIRGASPEQIIAYMMHFDSKVKLSGMDPKVEVRREVLDRNNLHHVVMFWETRAAPFRNRTFMNSFVWQKVSDAPLTYVWVNVPIERHDKVPPELEAHAVRADGRRSLKLIRIADDVTQLFFLARLISTGRFLSG